MLLSTIVPIGNLAVDYENLKKITQLSFEKPIELIFILDTDEKQALEQLETLCNNERLSSFQIIEGTGRNPGASRNLGISSAQGEWIVFCDSDDIPNFVNIMNSILQNEDNFDILIGHYETENLTLKTITTQSINFNSIPIWKSIAFNPGLWRWAIRKDLLIGTNFPEFSMGEDQSFLIEILGKEPKIKFLPEIFYRYRVGGRESLTSTKAKINDLIPIIKLELSQKSFPNKYIEFRNIMIIRQIFTLFKNGNLVAKLCAIIFLIKYILLYPPTQYSAASKSIVEVFKTTLNI
jgi:glycosyltransferase involved in cell wall biosynthesis